MMPSVREIFDRYCQAIRSCATCGRIQGCNHWLCEPCHQRLLTYLGPHSRQDEGVTHRYLLPWQPGDIFMDRLVKSLKGGRQKRVFSGLAQVMSGYGGQNAYVFYPSKGREDHAQVWADSLVRASQCDVSIPLRAIKVKGRGKQARLGRRDRAEARFRLRAQDELLSLDGARIIVADDIVTSGATWRACRQALGEPRELEVWSIFFRKSL